ncbi:site-specific DNA-methyltransferase [Escherichia coli]|uniref:site-specific DNA-methyltransferase n=2 Tax=Enterobacterales TaxID=91347 RepID=UPI0009281D33|nr:site-specific DNA-methyltransferase [Escherichia coli]KAA1327004.1 site-specific DNA-methyltransferase [Escherichia coli]MCC5160338.1 site-specific DNA-methyltransferase [Escherichia coli]MCL7103813.1 site-specific DNA-methyltransferase [Escherichia coli]MCL7109073.1 site-specific DNA-methyltransferase [Escherichia coli]MCL7118786.1 site-specific DNA-methyltransferase [Escherichia coli]
MSKTKLELTWIGKNERKKLEPRILLEDPSKSYHASQKVTENDIFDNKLIFGDNLLALKALEQEYAGKVKCVYIDPPFNTGSAFEHYDDGLEHSIWLGLMRDRLEIIRNLLSDDGVIFVHLDDCEMAYLKVLMDEIFGRANQLNTISMTTNDPSGFKATGATIFSTVNFLLVYAKDRTQKPLNKIYIPKGYDTGYNKYLLNPDDHYKSWTWCGIADAFAKANGYKDTKEAKKKLPDTFDDELAQFAIDNAERVFQSVAIGGGAKIKRKETIEKSKKDRDKVYVHPNEDVEGFYIANGRQMVFYSNRLLEIDGEMQPAELITDVWTDISWNGIANEGGVSFKNGKKPEALLKRIFEMCTREGDLVFDSFGGSGTTAAVAHKMKRRWISVELGDHCHTHIIPRLQKVIDGEDQGGISKSVNWQGGGGFRYYKLAPTLIVKDKFGLEVINKEYNPEMLAEAVCKLEGFTYAPSEVNWWDHGYSTETDHIYVTTQSLSVDKLEALSEEVGSDRTLLVMCGAFRCEPGRFTNLTLKKLPKAILDKCQFGQDDYSLNVANLTDDASADDDAAQD